MVCISLSRPFTCSEAVPPHNTHTSLGGLIVHPLVHSNSFSHTHDLDSRTNLEGHLFVNMKHDRSEEVRAVGIVFLVLPMVACLARCYVRVFMIRNFASDDWLAVVAQVFMTAYAGIIIASASTGVGRHLADLTLDERIVSMKMYAIILLIHYNRGSLADIKQLVLRRVSVHHHLVTHPHRGRSLPPPHRSQEDPPPNHLRIPRREHHLQPLLPLLHHLPMHADPGLLDAHGRREGKLPYRHRHRCDARFVCCLGYH